MTLISFVNFGIVAMTGLLLNMGSVGNSTMNQTVASDEAVESKGCAASFGKRTDLMFKYVGPDYTQAEVENLDNWEYTTSQNCGNEENDRACTILVSEEMVDFDSEENPIGLKDDLILTSNSHIFNVFYITGSNASSFSFYNEEQP